MINEGQRNRMITISKVDSIIVIIGFSKIRLSHCAESTVERDCIA